MSAWSTCSPAPIRFEVRCVASVIRIARPRPPPTCREVFTSPEASPACPSLDPWVAAIVEGTIDSAMPAAVRIPGIITYTIPLPLGAIRVSSSIPTVIMIRPLPSTSRTPSALTSRPALRATTPIATVIGRKISPVSSAVSPSTCCR